MHKLKNISGVWSFLEFHVVKRHFLHLFLKGSFNRNAVSVKNGFAPVKCLSVLAIQLFQAKLAATQCSSGCDVCQGTFPLKGEVSSLEGPDHSASEKATIFISGVKSVTNHDLASHI